MGGQEGTAGQHTVQAQNEDTRETEGEEREGGSSAQIVIWVPANEH